MEKNKKEEFIDLTKAVIIPGTNGKYLLFQNEKGEYRVYSKQTNKVLKDCHARFPPREYNIKHDGIMKMLEIETIKKMCK